MQPALLTLVASFGLALLAPASAPPAPQLVIRYVGKPEYTQHIFFAVLEGLYRDGVENSVVDAVLAEDPQSGWPLNFVHSCPICMPAREAFRIYRARIAFDNKEHSDTFGAGLAPEVASRLTGGDPYELQIALGELIQGWMQRRMDSLRLTPEERAQWKDDMAERRKEGLSNLEAYRAAGVGGPMTSMKDCPSCDAANGACALR